MLPTTVIPATASPATTQATQPLPVAPHRSAPNTSQRRRSTVAQHPLLTAFTLAYLGVVALVTLGPQPGGSLFRLLADSAMALVWRIDPGSGFGYSDLEFTANIAMFLPVGLLFVLLLGPRRWWLAIALGVLLTIGIEASQVFIPSRVPDARDLLANGTGAVLGSLVGVLLTALGRRRH